jgi:hypothetical protein
MKSIRSLTAGIELIGLLVIAMLITLFFAIQRNAVEQAAVHNREENVANIESGINLFLQDRTRNFRHILENLNAEKGYASAGDFNDLYLTDNALKVGEILAKETDSLLFRGYDLSRSTIGEYLARRVPEGITVSPVIRSAEHGSPSIYLASPFRGGYLVGRINLSELSTFLKSVANTLDSTLVIANRQGYVIASTDPALPVNIIPKANVLDKRFPEPVWLTRRTSASLGSELVLLAFIGLRTAMTYLMFTQPVGRLADMIATWRIDEAHRQPEDPAFRIREFDTVYRCFSEKAEEARTSYQASEKARLEAEQARQDLENSEIALQRMNEELESRVERRSGELQQA